MGIIGSIIVIYNYAESFRSDIKADNKSVKKELVMKIDSVCTHINNMETTMSVWMERHEAEQQNFVNSYAKYLSRDQAVTKEFFLEYMDGLEFDLKKKSVTGMLPIQ